MGWLVLLVIVVLPVIEIALFIEVTRWVGLIPTIALAIAVAMGGMSLLRTQGLRTLLQFRTRLEGGEPPVQEVFDGACLAVAGILMLLPGFFTDILAIPLLFPQMRVALRQWLALRKSQGKSGSRKPTSAPQIIEAEYRVISEEKSEVPPGER